MLTEIIIQNFVIAKDISIQLKNGLNVFTGETGAGKTLLMNAILFGLGHSIPKEAMGEEETRPYVRLTFSKIPPEVYQKIQEEGYDYEEDDSVILERTFSNQGKNRSRINGQMSTLQFFKEIGYDLIDFHGQRETGSLLYPKKQLEYLDAYIGENAVDLVKKIQSLRFQLSKIINQRVSFQKKEKEMQQEEELLQFQIQEIESAQVTPQEWESLQEERSQLENHSELITEIQNALRFLSEEDEYQDSASTLVQKSLKALASISSYSKNASSNLHTLETVNSIIKDSSHELHQELVTLETNYDPEKLEQVLDRIDVLQKLRSRYGPSYDEIKDTYSVKKKKLEEIQNQTHNISTLLEQEKQLRDVLSQHCIQLHNFRIEASKKLATEVENNLHQLSMPKAVFSVHFSSQEALEDDPVYAILNNKKVKVDARGVDQASFHFQSNAGLPMMPINKIASGGELSRIMLAIKATLKQNDQKNIVYIFDEIDSGINGVTGNKVGMKLKTISSSSQTLCITHLPQIASYSDSHYFIEKSTDHQTTIASVHELHSHERVKEIARMMGGDIESPTALEHAKEILLHASKSN
jgi:DNA repair protein RecN (Recombination protein N)